MTCRWCLVPGCNNNTKNTPEKLFIYVPTKPKMRKIWLEATRRDPNEISATLSVYICEDHFDDATPSHYYAVFDGHDGEHAAVYSANHLHQYLAESTNFTSNPEEAIKDAFCKTDSMFVKKCETDNINGGTTAVCSLLLPKEKTLYVAWVGDSQAALMSEGQVLPCVVPHKPDREDERKRIENDGGMVLYWGVWRVNGQLGVSRAIGDPEYKPYVTAIPEIVKIPLGGKEDFLVLGSDGLWDHVSFTEIANVVYNAVHTNPEKAQTVSSELVQLAKHYGSVDNISVIVVFLRDPHQIAAGPKWNTRLVSMDTLDNANNPFAIPNKTSNIDRITTQTEDGLLLDFGEELKKNDEIPNNDLIKMLEKSNRGRLTPDFDKEDNLGPETNVDNPDDEPLASPNFDTMKQQSEALNNNQNCNPFNDIEKSLELNLNLKAGTFEGMASPTEEECVPPANSVHNVSQLIDAGAESDSEEDEEWNYVRGEEANKENNKPLQLSSQVAEEEAEDIEDAMSQLNPNAAEFIPSPARAVASPLGRLLDEDQVLSRSPKKPPPTEVDINVPNQCEFEKDISQKPHEIEEAFSNGHQDGFSSETNAINALNSRLDEFHFGPNAAPFTPAKLLDQSETSSTKANFGDESQMTLGTSFNDSVLSQDQGDFVQKDDPMSMSFHQDRADDSNLFDLNKVHMLPEDVDEFIAKQDNTNSLLDDTISDLTEHYPLGTPEEKFKHEDEREFFTTDLDQEDKNMDNLQVKESSTPIDERSQSPLDIKMKEEDNRALSQKEETRTPIEESSHASSIEECKIPEVEEDSTARDNEQMRLESPYEQDEKPSSEEKEMYSTLEEKDVCSPDEEKDVCCLIQKHNEAINEEHEVFEDKDSNYEKDSNQRDYSSIREQDLAEKEVIEEKDTFNEKEVTPDNMREALSPVEGKDAISSIIPQEVTNDFMEEPKEIVSCEFISETSASFKPEPVASPLEENPPASLLQYGDVTCQETAESNISSPVLDEKVIDSSCQEDCSFARETLESPSLEQEISTAKIDEDDVAKIKSSESTEVTTNCDNLKSPTQDIGTVKGDQELLDLEIQKSDEEKAKENVENPSLLDNSNTVLSREEEHSIFTGGSIDVSEFSKTVSLCDEGANSEIQISQSQDYQSEKELISFSSPEQASSVLNVEKSGDISQSPPTIEQQADLSEVTCTPAVDTELVKAAEVAPASELKSPKPKEADKKPVTKAKTNPSTVGKKQPASATNKATTRPGPKPATSKVASKTTATTARTNTTTNRVPLTSRSTTTATKTNGTTKPATKPSTGAIKKSIDGSSPRNVTSATQNKTPSTARPATTSVRSTTAAAAPKPRPNTLKPASNKPVEAPKPATTRTVTAPRVPLTSRTATTKTSSLLNNKEVKDSTGKNLSKPRSLTDKQVKETANKLAASRTVSKVTSQPVSKTTVTKKSEVTGTKTTSRTSTATSKAPIKKPSEVTKAATTKVNKPKQNGVAAVVDQKIIVNEAPMELNGDKQFIKDNSPVDNKLITDQLSESAAN